MTTDYPQKITFGELRASGVRNVLVYCRDHHCSHHVEINADRWPDDVRLSDIEPLFTCKSWANAVRISGRAFQKRGWARVSVESAPASTRPIRVRQ